MNRNVVCVPPDMPLAELATFLSERMLSGVPVVDGEERLVGVVSLSDLAALASRRSLRDAYYSDLPHRDLGPLEALETAVVGDVMNTNLVFALEHAPVREVAEMMLQRRIHRMPVVRGGRVVGTVTTTDLIKLLLDTLPTAMTY